MNLKKALTHSCDIGPERNDVRSVASADAYFLLMVTVALPTRVTRFFS